MCGPFEDSPSRTTQVLRYGCSRRNSLRKRMAAVRSQSFLLASSPRRIISGASRKTALTDGMDDRAGQHLVLAGLGAVPMILGRAVLALDGLRRVSAGVVDRQQAAAAEHGYALEPLAALQMGEDGGGAAPQLPDVGSVEPLPHAGVGRHRVDLEQCLEVPQLRRLLLLPHGGVELQEGRELEDEDRQAAAQGVGQANAARIDRLRDGVEHLADDPKEAGHRQMPAKLAPGHDAARYVVLFCRDHAPESPGIAMPGSGFCEKQISNWSENVARQRLR